MELEVCGAVRVSISLAPCRLGYTKRHGHDVTLALCYCAENPRSYLDVEVIAEITRSLLGSSDRVELDDLVGLECASIEDLLKKVAEKAPEKLDDYRLCKVEAKWLYGERSITLRATSSTKS